MPLSNEFISSETGDKRNFHYPFDLQLAMSNHHSYDVIFTFHRVIHSTKELSLR